MLMNPMIKEDHYSISSSDEIAITSKSSTESSGILELTDNSCTSDSGSQLCQIFSEPQQQQSCSLTSLCNHSTTPSFVEIASRDQGELVVSNDTHIIDSIRLFQLSQLSVNEQRKREIKHKFKSRDYTFSSHQNSSDASLPREPRAKPATRLPRFDQFLLKKRATIFRAR